MTEKGRRDTAALRFKARRPRVWEVPATLAGDSSATQTRAERVEIGAGGAKASALGMHGISALAGLGMFIGLRAVLVDNAMPLSTGAAHVPDPTELPVYFDLRTASGARHGDAHQRATPGPTPA